MVRDAKVIVDTNADVNPTKGDIPIFTAADVYNSAVVYVDDSYVLPTKGDASCVSVADYCELDALHVSDVPLSCESDYCVLDMDFVPKPSHLATVS